jgi:hypothetical protein
MARLMALDHQLNRDLGLLPASLNLPEQAQIVDIACGPGGWVLQAA